tara:strand:+ start:124 stop:555 length:432 start_codon:yes stop_codon:yes gene_type:complete
MKAMLCEKFGPPEDLVLKEVANLIPLAGQVRIATEACGVNFPDTLIIENKYQFKPELPFAPGGEVTGIVDAVGDGVSQDLLGQPVMCMTLSGGFAEQTLCKAEDLIARPISMPSQPSRCGLELSRRRWNRRRWRCVKLCWSQS